MSNGRRKTSLRRGYLLAILLVAGAQGSRAQVQVGDDLRMNLNGVASGGYAANYGDNLPSNHGLNYGGSADLSGIYYSPNFLTFSAVPYYNQSRTNSSFQSLTDATGIDTSANFFTGSRYPGSASYHYTRNSTGNFGLVGAPNFTTVGNSQGFGVGWSVLIPDWPTLSVSYSQGSGDGTVFGTNELTNASTKTLNVNSAYKWRGWQLNGGYNYQNIYTSIPYFLTGSEGRDNYHTVGSAINASASHSLPWNGNLGVSFVRSTYDGDSLSTFSDATNQSNFTTDVQTALVSFRPTLKLGLYANETYTDNLGGYLYQSVVNGGGGVPIIEQNSQSNSLVINSGVNYSFTKALWGQAQMTYFNQSYLGRTYDGSYFSASIAYNKRIFETFTVSAAVVESTNRFTNNALGFIANLNAFHRIGLWELAGSFSYAQNVQSYLVTYTTSYYNYNANLHRRLGHGMQWTGSFNGSHSGFSRQPGTLNESEGFSTSLALRRITLTGNYSQYRGQSILTTSGIQPITTPGLPPEGIVVYNGHSYGAGLGLTPVARMTLSANYAHATSETQSVFTPSNNHTEVFYAQLQYRLRQITLLAGYTKFTQGISAYGVPAATNNSYFAGVTRYFNFF